MRVDLPCLLFFRLSGDRVYLEFELGRATLQYYSPERDFQVHFTGFVDGERHALMTNLTRVDGELLRWLAEITMGVKKRKVRARPAPRAVA